jgi:FKBP-type peptidyl-prolyl cis-trans isomerase SlyD
MSDVVQANSHVTLGYVLRSGDGEVLDASSGEGGEPIRYVQGYGMIVPGLEAAVAGMRVGDKKTVKLTAEQGYGTHDDELVLEIDRSEFPEPAAVTIGDEFVAESPDGDQVAMRVVEVHDASVVVDANHPLAGLAIEYDIEVEELRDATEEEIAAAAAELEEAHAHVHGPDCDHDHDHDHAHEKTNESDLVSLGRKPKTGSAVH